MPERGGFKQNMELRNIFIFIIFVLFSENLYADLIKPNKNLGPHEVVKIQLEALKKK